MKNEKKLKLTEREIDIILYLNENKKPQNIEALQKKFGVMFQILKHIQ